MAALPTVNKVTKSPASNLHNKRRFWMTSLFRRRIWSTVLTILTVVVAVVLVKTYISTGNVAPEDEELAVKSSGNTNEQVVKSTIKAFGVDDNGSIGSKHGSLNEYDSGNDHIGKIKKKPFSVFCLGDSLTYGLSPPERQPYPYSQSLQQSLNECLMKDETDPVTTTAVTVVDHAGFSGWMSNELLALICPNTMNEECPTLSASDGETLSQRIQPFLTDKVRDKILAGAEQPNDDPGDSTNHQYPYDVFVYLAGTNDLGRPQRTVENIVESIVSVHKWAHDIAKIKHTIALGIPPSAYQSRRPEASQKAEQINTKLEAFCDSTASSETEPSNAVGILDDGDKNQRWAYYVPFPFEFVRNEHHHDTDADEDDNNTKIGDLWSPDGLHLSPDGYDRLGRDLARILVKEILGYDGADECTIDHSS